MDPEAVNEVLDDSFEFVPVRVSPVIQYFDRGVENAIPIDLSKITKESMDWALSQGHSGQSAFRAAVAYTERKLAAEEAKKNPPPPPPPPPTPNPPEAPAAAPAAASVPPPAAVAVPNPPPTAPAPSLVHVVFELDGVGQFEGAYNEVIVDDVAGFAVLVRDVDENRGATFWPSGMGESKDLAMACKNGDTGYIVRSGGIDFTYRNCRFFLLRITAAFGLNDEV